MSNPHPIRKPNRLPDFDYSQPGSYFVTMVIQHRQAILGCVVDGQMILSEPGQIVQKTWDDLPTHYPGIHLDGFVVMPNHVHGLITIIDSKYPLTEIIRGYKSFSARGINLARNEQGQPVWQRSFYDHIIRDEKEFQKILDYIETNPIRWDEDGENIFPL